MKAGGHMAGMHRDKCGAAFVAGFFKVHVVTQILLSTSTSVRPGLCQCHQRQPIDLGAFALALAKKDNYSAKAILTFSS